MRLIIWQQAAVVQDTIWLPRPAETKSTHDRIHRYCYVYTSYFIAVLGPLHSRLVRRWLRVKISEGIILWDCCCGLADFLLLFVRLYPHSCHERAVLAQSVLFNFRQLQYLVPWYTGAGAIRYQYSSIMVMFSGGIIVYVLVHTPEYSSDILPIFVVSSWAALAAGYRRIYNYIVLGN